VMENLFTRESDMFGEDLFHASAQGHLAFSDVGKPVADRLVEIWQKKHQTPDTRHQNPEEPDLAARR